jgi:two-component system LytT family response regulator
MPTALLVDDEPSASARLGDLLAAYEEIEVLGAVRSVELAVAFIEGRAPDIVFLDVEMPGGSGLSLLEKLPAETEVCFVTAYSKYAVSAYDFGAVDYLVKPVDPDRLEVAVTRILRACGNKTAAPSPESSDSPAKSLAATFVIPLRDGGAKTVIRCDDILWIEGMGNYSRICVAGDGKPMLVRRSLAQWEKDLPEKTFSRLGRSQLVRPERLALVTWQSRSETVLTFTGSTETLTIGRASAARLREITDATPTE